MRRKSAETNRALDGVSPALVGPDPDSLLDVADKDLAVSDFPGLGRLRDHVDGARNQLVGEDDFQFHFGQKINRVFTPSIDLGMTFLASKAFHFAHGHAFDPDLGERFSHVLHFEGLDDRLDFFHAVILELDS